MTDDATHELEDHIELLRRLDKKRIESAKLRDSGFDNILRDGGFDNIQGIIENNVLHRESFEDEIELQKKLDEFKKEFTLKTKECPLLIFDSISVPNSWTVAGFLDFGAFKEKEISGSNDKLVVELQKYPANNSKIIKLVASKINLSLSRIFSNIEVNIKNLNLLKALSRKQNSEDLSDEKKEIRKTIFDVFTIECE